MMDPLPQYHNVTLNSPYDFGKNLKPLPVIVCCGDIASSQRSHKPRRRSGSEAGQVHNLRNAPAGGAAPTQHAHSDGPLGGPPGFAGPPALEAGLELQELGPLIRLPVG